MAKTKGSLHVGSLRWMVERLKVGEYLYIHNEGTPNDVASRIHTLYRNHEETSLNKHGLVTEQVLVVPVLIKEDKGTVDKILRIQRVFDDPYL